MHCYDVCGTLEVAPFGRSENNLDENSGFEKFYGESEVDRYSCFDEDALGLATTRLSKTGHSKQLRRRTGRL